MKKFYLALKDFALPSPMAGSIDTYSGFGVGSKRAIKIHQEIQTTLQKENALYEAEVPIMHTFVKNGLQFQISGRMDGIYRTNPVSIEEIKTAFDTKKLITSLHKTHFTHPYWLQLQTYGYITWLQTNKMPHLTLLIGSLRNKKTTAIPLDFNSAAYEEWLDRRLDDLTLEVKHATQRMKRRYKESSRLQFPFAQPRPNQKELIETVTKQMAKNKPMLLQAPTGLGKTTGILFPSLKESLSRGQKTVYVTPKNSQHQIAVDSVRKLQSKGTRFKSLVLTSKKKICMKNEPLCNASYCEFAQDHYTKATEHQLLTQVGKRKNLNASYFKKLAVAYKVCPYELQMDSIPYVDVVIGDYNYVFSSQNQPSRVATLHFAEQEKANLVIDEVHNVISRSMDYYSPGLYVSYFERLLANVSYYPSFLQDKLTTVLNGCIALMNQCAEPGVVQSHRVNVPINLFKKQEEKLNDLLNLYLESEAAIESGDAFLKGYNYWTEFTASLDNVEGNEAFITSFNPQQQAIKITCCDASEFLKDSYNNFKHIVGFSATLKPFDYYSRLMGLPSKIHTQEFTSPFPAARRKLLIIPQVSTRFSDRARSYAKLIDAIKRITAIRPGNYFIFFPSFDYLEKIYLQFPPLPDFIFLKQERNMDCQAVRDLLDRLSRPGLNHLFFAVQGGMFAEGIDYSGDRAIGAFIIGPPLPMYDWEREQMKTYYENKYGAGKEYAYIYPAMAKAIQAAGRVIRSETDSGLIVLFDNRFLNATYSQCMPQDWFKANPQELLSQSIINDISIFWDSLALKCGVDELVE